LKRDKARSAAEWRLGPLQIDSSVNGWSGQGSGGEKKRVAKRTADAPDCPIVQEAFGTVIVLVVIVGTVCAVISIVGLGRAYDQIGHGGMSLFDGTDRPVREPSTGAEADSVRDEEIRQLMEARNAVRASRGRPPIDIDAKIATFARSAADPEIVEEVRVLVELRNRRLVREGKPELDVQAEIERQLRDLT
jgi:hypothetical protein